ncbi:MAG TPA: hypothetical protein VF669_12355, partial [Tepidisphaeraceae bacterium]
ASDFVIAFDAGDARWLRGYCHLLMALNDIAIAYDERELFDATAHLFFRKVETPYPFLNEGRRVMDYGFGADIADIIAFVHLIRCPLKEPARMQSALKHLQTMVQLSRESWKLYLAETDDDHEWIPNPKQASVVTQVRVTDEMVARWHQFLDVFESLLAGKSLAPFWRGNETRGININKFFMQPPDKLDLVLWIQGSAVAPYLQEGQITDQKAWQEIWRAFGRESFFGFAVWFN